MHFENIYYIETYTKYGFQFSSFFGTLKRYLRMSDIQSSYSNTAKYTAEYHKFRDLYMIIIYIFDMEISFVNLVNHLNNLSYLN